MAMLGRATHRLAPPPKRWLRRIWGVADIHMRQKWRLLWPLLETLPRYGVRLLDAGCGDGDWSLELAARRPSWEIVGVDIDPIALEGAERARRQLRLDNVSFIQASFLELEASGFDAVLSVGSAHYLAEQGHGAELFDRFRSWLEPGGRLFLIGPRRTSDVWFTPLLARPDSHPVFTEEELRRLCGQSALAVEKLDACVGQLATVAKQLGWEAERRGPAWLQRALYPVQWSFTATDSLFAHADSRNSLMWILVARAVAESSGARSAPAAGSGVHAGPLS